MAYKHGMRHTRFYHIWDTAKRRCTNPNNKDFARYGERGISFCDEWLNFSNFKEDMYESYLAHVEEYGELDTQIDRIDNSKGYSPENCRWVTQREQLNNRGRYQAVGTNGRKTNWGKRHAD